MLPAPRASPYEKPPATATSRASRSSSGRSTSSFARTIVGGGARELEGEGEIVVAVGARPGDDDGGNGGHESAPTR